MKWVAMFALALALASWLYEVTAFNCFAVFVLCLWNAYLWRNQ